MIDFQKMTVAQRRQKERAALITLGFKMGWIKLQPPQIDTPAPAALSRTQKPGYDAELARKNAKSAANRANGLTWDGRKRTRKCIARPELKGLNTKEYHREHMKKWRAEKAQSTTNN